MTERVRRFLCSWFGHRWLETNASVVPLVVVCRRCEAWARVFREPTA
jgi:hypothetical protein